MQEIIKLQNKIVPELVELLDKRYSILKTIMFNGPIGRRALASQLGLSERIVRTEISFLNVQGLIDVNTSGMTVTKSGKEIIEKLSGFIHEMKGLRDIETDIEKALSLKKVIIVPGDVSLNQNIMKDLGKAASNYLKTVIKDNSIIALTGGSSVKEVVEAFPKTSKFSNVLVVPARGGMGKKIETQANTLAESLAKKLEGNHKLLHLPENLSLDIINSLMEVKDINDVVESIKNADVLIYGVGNAEKMAKKRGISESEILELTKIGAVGEAFGCYFNKDSKVVSEMTTIGININNAKHINTLIAVAGGSDKVEPIIVTQLNNTNGVLVTDEGTGRKILEVLANKKK